MLSNWLTARKSIWSKILTTSTATAIAIIDTFTQLRKLARTIDKVNEDAKEQGILPDKATEGKIQAAMNEVFADKHFKELENIPFPKVEIVGIDDFLKYLKK